MRIRVRKVSREEYAHDRDFESQFDGDAARNGEYSKRLCCIIVFAMGEGRLRLTMDDCVLISQEMCNADSNKLVVVADQMLPMLNHWLTQGTLIQQYTAARMLAMVSNRFDLAKNVIDSPCLGSLIKLFNAVHR
jgi:hypothetical protein